MTSFFKGFKIGQKSQTCAILASFLLMSCVETGINPDRSEGASIFVKKPAPKQEQEQNNSVDQKLGPQKYSIAVLLPLTGPERKTGEALLNMINMAYFDAYNPLISLQVYDTGADPHEAARQAQAAIEQGASLILGPLLADSVIAAGEISEKAGVPLIGFSNNARAAGPLRYIFGFRVEEEVSRITDYAYRQGCQNFAALAPNGLYGDRVISAYEAEIDKDKLHLYQIERYEPDPSAFAAPVRRLADYERRRRAQKDEIDFLKSLKDSMTDEIAHELAKEEVYGKLDFDAVLIAEGGENLKGLIPLLPFYEIDLSHIRLLGTGLWNDKNLLSEPNLEGAWFAAPAFEKSDKLLKRYEGLYSEAPPRLATLGYDAFALVAYLVREQRQEAEKNTDGRLSGEDLGHKEITGRFLSHGNPLAAFTRERFERPEGFMGVDGPVRLRSDGLNERGLAIVEFSKRGISLREPAPNGFYVLVPDGDNVPAPDTLQVQDLIEGLQQEARSRGASPVH